MVAVTRLWRAGHAAQRGQGLIEFALVLPVIMLLVMGAIDLGRGVFAYNALANAARHGARVAAVNQLNPPNSNTMCSEDMPIEDLAEPHWSAKACTAASAFSLGVTPGAVSVTYSSPSDEIIDCSGTLHVGCDATVTVSAVWQPITPVISSLVGPITLRATSQQPLERIFP